MSKGKCLPVLLLGTTLLAAELPLLPAAEDETQLQSMLDENKEKGQLFVRLRGQEFVQGLGGARLYQRLEWRSERGREAYLLVEKDPGEGRWADFAAFYLQWQSSFKPLQILLGDMRPGFGQGLVFGRSGKGRNSVSPTLKNDSKSVAFRSKGENEALRGLILRYRGGRIEGAILGGLAARDARLDEQGNAISLRPGGIHVSASELAGRKRLQAWSCGLRLRYLAPHWRGGASLLGIRFNRWVDLRRPGKTPWAFRGRRQCLGGVDFQWSAGAVKSALEIARDRRANWGGIVTIRIALGKVRLRGLGRYYAPGFHSFFGAAASAAGMQNESGCLLAIEGRVGHQQWRLQLDQYALLQPSYTMPIPGATQVWSFATERKLLPSWHLQLLYEERTRPRWRAGERVFEHRGRGRLGVEFRDRDGIQARLRLEGCHLRRGDGVEERGGLLSLLWQRRRQSSSYTFHLSRFLSHSYRSRIYEFEYHLPGTMSIRPLYGDGWRLYAMGGVQWRGLKIVARYRHERSQLRGGALHNIGLQVDFQIARGDV